MNQRKTKKKEKKEKAAQEAEAAKQAQEASAGAEDQQAPREETLEHWQDRALRAQAEMVNMRRRLETDVEDRTRARMEAMFHELIMVTDHMELALSAVPESLHGDKSSKSFLDGVRAIQKALESTLERFGLQRIQPQPDQEFDPEQHEAVHVEEKEGVENSELAVLRRGYRMGNRILRPAQVRLIRPLSNSATNAAENTDGDQAQEGASSPARDSTKE